MGVLDIVPYDIQGKLNESFIYGYFSLISVNSVSFRTQFRSPALPHPTYNTILNRHILRQNTILNEHYRASLISSDQVTF